MECNQFKSVVALVDSLVCSAHARRSRVLLRNFSVRAPVSSKSLTDFSICSILGLETDVTQSSLGSGKLHFISIFYSNVAAENEENSKSLLRNIPGLQLRFTDRERVYFIHLFLSKCICIILLSPKYILEYTTGRVTYNV